LLLKTGADRNTLNRKVLSGVSVSMRRNVGASMTNAAEWVEDQLSGDYSWCANGCVDPHSPKDGPFILKGGGIGSLGMEIRISYRMTLAGPTGVYSGIRCARDGIEHDTNSDGGVDAGMDSGVRPVH
jgi:hypothetical protein